MRCAVQYASWCWMSASLDSLIINLYEAVMIVSLHLSAHEGSGLLPEFFFSRVFLCQSHFLVQNLCCLLGSTGFVLVWLEGASSQQLQRPILGAAADDCSQHVTI